MVIHSRRSQKSVPVEQLKKVQPVKKAVTEEPVLIVKKAEKKQKSKQLEEVTLPVEEAE